MVRESQPAMKVWSAAQLEQFLNLTSDSRYHPAWTMLATTGMRRGEALGLAWADVDLESRKASIRRVRIVVIDAAQTGPTKTGKSRSIELDARTIATLRAWKARQLRERLLMGVGYNDEGYVFTHPDGQPYHPKRFSREFDRAIARYGLDRVRLHDLRHTWATLALEAGVHPKIVSEHLDHSSTTITLDTYSHVTQAMASDAAEQVAELIFGSAQ
jgi:integrase